MFDFVKSRRIVTGIILGLLAIPFAFFGIDFYFRGGDPADQVAKVAGTRITGREYSEALRQRQESLRQSMRGQVDQALLDSPQLRQAVLDQLVDERIVYAAALKAGVTVTDADLQTVIASIPAFRENGGTGKFSRDLYVAALRGQGMSEAGFESLLRKDLVLSRARGSTAGTSFVPTTVLDRLYKLRQQQREVSQAVFAPAQFTAQVKLEPNAAQAFYDAHKDQFRLPEKVRVEYVVLSLDGIQRQVEVTQDEIKQYYEEHKAQFQTPEERRASHILIAAPASATPEQRAKAKARAEALLAEVKKSPKAFADLAKKNSEDPGSGAEGGDLGFSPRGRMVKPFDDALFGMKVGEIVGPVETQYGYHIIKLDAIKGGEGPKFETVKPKIEEEVRKGKAGKRFAEAAESFSNIVYEQPDSLKPAIDQFKLEPQKSGWITRQGGDAPLLNNEKFLRSLFSDEVLKNKRNTEAIEIAPNMLIAARIVEREPSVLRPFADVQADIVRQLTLEKAMVLAKQDGEAKLAQLRKGDAVQLTWSPGVNVTRDKAGGLHPEAVRAVFGLDAAKLPAYQGLEAPDGRYVIYRVGKVTNVETVDAEARKGFTQQVDQVSGMEAAAASLANQKKKADVQINRQAVDKSS
jgi:peptidyl-prolyl cis-trans isomerase D